MLFSVQKCSEYNTRNKTFVNSFRNADSFCYIVLPKDVTKRTDTVRVALKYLDDTIPTCMVLKDFVREYFFTDPQVLKSFLTVLIWLCWFCWVVPAVSVPLNIEAPLRLPRLFLPSFMAGVQNFDECLPHFVNTSRKGNEKWGHGKYILITWERLRWWSNVSIINTRNSMPRIPAPCTVPHNDMRRLSDHVWDSSKFRFRAVYFNHCGGILITAGQCEVSWICRSHPPATYLKAELWYFECLFCMMANNC